MQPPTRKSSPSLQRLGCVHPRPSAARRSRVYTYMTSRHIVTVLLLLAGGVRGLAQAAGAAKCGRRAALLGAAAACSTLALPANAAPINKSDPTFNSQAIVQRARAGQLTPERVLERAKAGRFFDPNEANPGLLCKDIEAVKRVDNVALSRVAEQLQNLNALMRESQADGSAADVAAMSKRRKQDTLLYTRIQNQIILLRAAEANESCAGEATTF